MPKLRWLLVMESRSEPESSTAPRYRLWLTPLDESDVRAVKATSFATADELLQALFARWDRHFQLAGPDTDGSLPPVGPDDV